MWPNVNKNIPPKIANNKTNIANKMPCFALLSIDPIITLVTDSTYSLYLLLYLISTL